MNSKATYILVGVFVLLLSAALVGGVLWFGSGGPGPAHTRYVVYMKESVSGLSKDAAVKYRGVDVGRVRGIALDPVNPEQVRLVLEIRQGTPVKTDTVATLETQGLTGLASINLTGGSRDAPLLRATGKEPYPVIKSRRSLLGRLDQVLSRLLENLTETSARLNDLLNQDNRHAMAQTLAEVHTLSKTLAGRSTTLASALDDFAAAARGARRTADRLPTLLARIERAAAALARMADTVAVAGKGVQRTVAAGGSDLHRLTTDLLPAAQALVGELRQSAANLRHLSDELKRDPSVLLYGPPTPRPGPGE